MPASSSSHDLTETAPPTERLTADLGDPELGDSAKDEDADTKPGEAGPGETGRNEAKLREAELREAELREAELRDSKLGDAVHDDDEATVVMGRADLPDFEKSPRRFDAENRPPQRPSTFTRLLLNPRRT